ncbi:hypothetical protein [Microbacterium sp.]|uniref:hypothetical protein n=1 Tax=Microbacterium sp. TaxID=51671 RepID=UPI002FE38692
MNDLSRAQLAPYQPREDRVTLGQARRRVFEAIAFVIQIGRVIFTPKKGRHTR